MLKKGTDDYRYSAISIQSKIAKRFRSFSKKVSKSHSETLSVIMNFFEWHGFLPSDRFDQSIVQEIVKSRKRTEAIIAIIKDIEKSQTKPTNAMLLSLFEEKVMQEEPELIEKKFSDKVSKEKQIEDTTVPKIRYERLEDKMNLVKSNFEYVLNHVKLVKSNFGKDYFKLELSEQTVTKLKRTLKNT